MRDVTLENFYIYTPVKVRFAETDANGHMSHVSAVIYFEQARCEFLEGIGLFHPKEVVEDGRTFVLAKQQVEYHKQAYFNDELEVYIRVGRIGNSSLDLPYAIVKRDTKEVLITGDSTVVFFDRNTQKSTPLPSDLRERVEQLEQRFKEKAKHSTC